MGGGGRGGGASLLYNGGSFIGRRPRFSRVPLGMVFPKSMSVV